MAPKNRWYDAHPKLAESLDILRVVDKATRDRIVAQVIAYLNDNSPDLLENHLLEFPLDRERRRWYDKDPYLWLMVNSLRYAPKDLLRKVTKNMGRVLKSGERKTKSAVRPSKRPKRRPKPAGRSSRHARQRRPAARKTVRP